MFLCHLLSSQSFPVLFRCLFLVCLVITLCFTCDLLPALPCVFKSVYSPQSLSVHYVCWCAGGLAPVFFLELLFLDLFAFVGVW